MQKAKTWVKRWAYDGDLVDFYNTDRLWATDVESQMRYARFLDIFGILLKPGVVYSLKVSATARPTKLKTR